jgi:hypothetical protein
MRSYLRLLFHDKAGAASDGSRKFKGLAWLFMGASAGEKGSAERDCFTVAKECILLQPGSP